MLTLNDRAADRADHRFDSQVDEYSNHEEEEDNDDASVVRWEHELLASALCE